MTSFEVLDYVPLTQRIWKRGLSTERQESSEILPFGPPRPTVGGAGLKSLCSLPLYGYLKIKSALLK
jgi:hypothetical protein